MFQNLYNLAMQIKAVLLLLIILTACAPQPDAAVQIPLAVASTLTALPTNAPAPISTPLPSPTSFNLAGLFCEYQFCIGHPVDIAFYDVSAQQNPAAPSSYSQGLLAAYSGNLFIQIIWQLAPGASDPNFLLDLILEEGIDTRLGAPSITSIRNMNVISIAIASAATSLLPYGGAAAWTCGDRVFAWKVYTPDESSAPALFDAALARFICNR
ncbi:MAG: hypothetical protein HKUEN02_14390 [Anaerolineaceae bacterium]|nr:MAG: hypothetical protein HKUEN02_14390 [Anaerolineaceae bacterium]